MEDTIVPLFFNSYFYLRKDPAGVVFECRVWALSPDQYLICVAFFGWQPRRVRHRSIRASERYFTNSFPKIRDALQRGEESELDGIPISVHLLSTYEISYL